MGELMYAGVKALIERDGKYLLVGSGVEGEILWSLPGGRLEKGERPTEALEREVKGETSLDIEPGETVGMYSFRVESKDMHVCLTVFEAASVEGEPELDTEHAREDGLEDYRWMTEEEIREVRTNPELQEMLERKAFRDAELPKIVRDRIPEKIRMDGKSPEVNEVTADEAENWLRRKILEEAEEFAEDGEISELADLKAVLEKYMEMSGIDYGDLEELEEKKRSERGGFESLKLLESIDKKG
ncbi:MAG: NUDIX domain-containing protein [Candidatus Nanohaloarchaea archaeon]